MRIINLKTNEVIENFKDSFSCYLVKCESLKYATHIDDNGNYYCMYGAYAAFDGEQIINIKNSL